MSGTFVDLASQGLDDSPSGNGSQGGQVGNGGPTAGAKTAMRWTPVMSGFILRRFVELVGHGVKTDKGFKEVHVNNVARSLSEFSGQEVTGTQVYNHLRKWRQRWVRICRLKDLSGANWDENTCTIVLDDEHLLGHTKDHPKDAEFLNCPIENYLQMQIIFGSGQATGRFAMGSNEPLGNPSAFTESNVTSEGFTAEKTGSAEDSMAGSGAGTAASAAANGVGYQGTKATEETGNLGKRRRSLTDEEVGIFTGLTGAVHSVAEAFKAPVVVQNIEVPPNLYSLCMATPGFLEEDLMAALSYLLDNERQAEGFVLMTEAHRTLWIRQHLTKIRAKQPEHEEHRSDCDE